MGLLHTRWVLGTEEGATTVARTLIRADFLPEMALAMALAKVVVLLSALRTCESKQLFQHGIADPKATLKHASDGCRKELKKKLPLTTFVSRKVFRLTSR